MGWRGWCLALFGSLAAVVAGARLLGMRLLQSATDAAALGDVRSVLQAEVVYANANGGLYDSLECLAQPERCLPPDADRTRFLDPALASSPERHGYRFRFHAGRPALPAMRAGNSPSSLCEFAYSAVPATDARSWWMKAVGVPPPPSFCGELSLDAPTPRVCRGSGAPVAARCPEQCTSLP